jgi:hypothetical protein
MSDYIPPQQVQIQNITNFARPDGRDRIQTTAEYLGDGFTVGLSHGFYLNPDIQASKLSIEFSLSDRTSATIGGSLVEGDLIPEIAFTSVIVDESNQRLLLYAERGLNDSDPRAIAALIQQNVIGASFRLGSSSTRAQVTFNSDGIEVYENWISIPLTDNSMVTLNNYVRVSSDRSDFYWSPSSFVATGLLVGLPIELSESATCQIGVQPGVIVEEGELELGAAVGSRCRYVRDRFSLNGSLSYGYGFTGLLTASWTL